MARRISTTASAHSPSEESILRFDDAPEFSVGYAEEEAGDDKEQQVREAQHRLAALRSQQEEVERQKLILETLRHKQERFVAGKKEITDKLDRALRIIADELEDANTDQRIRSHAYDHNGVRVTCLLSDNAPFEDTCSCGHVVVAASPVAVFQFMGDHITWAQKASLHG